MLRSLRPFLWALAATVTVAAAAWYMLAPRVETKITDTMGKGDYHLTMTNGQPFTMRA